MSPRHVPASVTELSRVGLFGSLPGETVTRLATEMRRVTVAAGKPIVNDGFAALLSGIAAVESGGSRTLVRPGDEIPKGAVALTGCVVATCDRATLDRIMEP